MLEYLNKLKPETWPSPCFVTDLALLRKNVDILDRVQLRTAVGLDIDGMIFVNVLVCAALDLAQRVKRNLGVEVDGHNVRTHVEAHIVA